MTQQLLTVACPQCGARVGQRCRNLNTRYAVRPVRPCLRRWDAAEKAMREPAPIPDPPVVEDAIENNPPPKKNLRHEAEAFIYTHPKVFALYERYSLAAASRRETHSISLLTEKVRHEIDQTWEPDRRGFKLNNNHRPYIARALIAKHPHLAEFLRCRQTVY